MPPKNIADGLSIGLEIILTKYILTPILEVIPMKKSRYQLVLMCIRFVIMAIILLSLYTLVLLSF